MKHPSDFGWEIALPFFLLPVYTSGQPLHVVAEVLATPEKALGPLVNHATPKRLHILCKFKKRELRKS